MTSPGTRIKELRLLADLSQEELGRRVGVQRAAINKYEKGRVTNIPIETIEKMATVFDVSPTYIVGWHEDKSSNPLAAEAKVLSGVKRFYGGDGVDLLESFTNLNSKGRKRLLEYSFELEQIPMYIDEQKQLPDLIKVKKGNSNIYIEVKSDEKI